MQPDPAETGSNTDDDSAAEFGAVDIVAAFTALRHDLKLQIRHGGDMQQMLAQRLDRLEKSLTSVATAPATPASPAEIPESESRRFAVAITEIDDALHRVLEGMNSASTTGAPDTATTSRQIQHEISGAGRIARLFAGKILNRIASLNNELAQSESGERERTELARQGLELLQQRIRRLMGERQLERRDVAGQRFDGSMMNALDAVATSSVPPGHVAEQLRAAYLWRGAVLVFADVRVARQ